MRRRRAFVGLAVEDGAVLAAEVDAVGGRLELRRTAAFAVPEGLSLEAPSDLGRALGVFLGEREISARQAVIGVSAKSLLIKEKILPMASDEALVAMLRIEAEQAFSMPAAELAVDFAQGGATDAGRAVLLVAAARSRVEQLTEMARAAGVTVLAITPSVTTLAGGRMAPDPAVVVHLRPDNVDLAVHAEGSYRLVRHVATVAPPGTEAWLEDIGRQLRRLLSLMPRHGEWPEPRQVEVTDGVGLDPEVLAGLGRAVALPTLVRQELSIRGVAPPLPAYARDAARFAAPVALAATAAGREVLPLDLLHSKLESSAPGGLRRWAIPAAAAATAAAVVVAAALLLWRGEEKSLTALGQRLRAMAGDVAAAAAVVDNVSLVRRWYDRRPEMLGCLRELTLAFPEHGEIFATSLAIREDLHAVVSGKATDEALVLDVLDRLQRNPKLDDLTLLHMRQAGGADRYVSFAISFSCREQE